MRVVSIDIDPKGNLHRIHLGPFVAGLNAVYGARGAGKSTIAKFIRQLLYSRNRDRSGTDYRTTDEFVGSLQWADANGNSRVISTSDPVDVNDYRFNGAYHWSARHDALSANASDTFRPSEQPWHRIGGETFDAVFCGRLGETLPERLWAAARELGIAIRFDLEDDETYRRLRAEERRLQERLHHLRVDDRDQAWWTAERRRLASRLEELHAHPELARNEREPSHVAFSTNEARPVVQQWRSQLTELQSRLATMQRQEAEIAKQIADTKYNLDHFATIQRDDATFKNGSATNSAFRRSTQIHNDAYGSWVGYADRLDENDPHYTSSVRTYATGAGPIGVENYSALERNIIALQEQRLKVRNEIANLHRSIRTLEGNLQGARNEVRVDATLSWEVEELQKRLAYADEVLQSWTLYEQTRARLAEIQSQLRGHGPYRKGMDTSFLNSVERFVRELSAGALRGLPTWAMEALRRDQSYVTGLSKNGKPESYREVYRDYRPDASQIDFVVPPSTAPERQIVELAIRMAIIDASAHRIGRLPLILDDALDGFHGQQLEHLVRVIMQFARDGMQVLLLTSEEEVAQRVRAQQGWVSHLTEARTADRVAESIDRAIDYRYVPNRTEHFRERVVPAVAYQAPSYVQYTAPAYSTIDINRELAAEAELRYAASERPVVVNRYYHTEPKVVETAAPTVKLHPQFFLSETSRVEDAPGVSNVIAERLRKLGILTVGQFIETDANWIADSLRVVDFGASEVRSRQREALLMCCVPQLRAFDARVLVGCGIDKPSMLADMRPAQLLQRVESFLGTDHGQAILRSGTSYELSRITTWIASARRSVQRSSQPSENTVREPRYRDVERRSLRSPRSYESSNSSDYGPRFSDRVRGERRRVDRGVRPSTRAETVREPRERILHEHVASSRTDRSLESQRSSNSATNPGFVRVERTTTTRPATNRPAATRSVVQTTTRTSQRGLRFYLELDSPVVDAPSIGPRMAERLAPLGILTVRDLLECNPQRIADQLDDKRFDEQTIIDWQDQARMVCTVPNLRGHDAQILVACNVRTADQLATQQIDSLLASSTSYVSSKAGQRLLRGAEAPDRAEVTDWISWSQQSRSIKAA